MVRPQLNRRLTTTDAAFLYVEKPGQPMHIASCGVYEGHISAAELQQLIVNRLHLLPRYRQKVVFPPFSLAHPTWEDDTDFDIANHVEEMTLPAPADDRVLSEVGGRIHAQMLDRRRPLWKLVLLHGREDGSTAMLAMVHHAMVDGVSGVDLQMVLHDLTPDAEPPAPLATEWEPQPTPDALTLMQDAIRDRLTEAARQWTDEAFRLLRPAAVEERARQLSSSVAATMPQMLVPAPRTPFNGPVSNQRQFAWAEFPFAEIRAIRSALGGTVNDVVLAVLSGGLGRYLRAHNYPTQGTELRAMCPVSMRQADERGALGNLVSMMIAPLYVGITDPIERFTATRAGMEKLKNQNQAAGLYTMTEMANLIPPAWQALALRFDAPNTLLNTVSTNVPGPQIPLYLAGRKLAAWYPLGPLASSIGLFNAILSYNQKLTFGATVDPKQVPDVWFYMDCLKESFAEVRAAAEQVAAAAAPTALPAAAPPPAAPPPAATAAPAPVRRRKAATPR
jgi:diacylglycerol O-acyltransferase